MIILRKSYNKFGAKTEMAYGNSMVTTYMYNPVNLRLDSLVACLQANKYFSMGYRYDAKGNVDTLYSTYSCFYGGQLVTQAFTYDSTDQLVSAIGKSGSNTTYSAAISYTNWGKIGRYTTSINGSDTFMYPSTNPVSTHFAPNSSVNNGNTTTYEFGINGSLRKKENNVGTEYYLFNAFNCMKVYSYNGERYGYYGYDASDERMYKMDINYVGIFTNENEEVFESWELEKMMLYPNGYMNMNQSGEYTKHYYADALRIASKIGSGFNVNLCDKANDMETDYPNYLSDRMTEQYNVMLSEIYQTTERNPEYTVSLINPYQDLCNLAGNAQETDIFYYHPDHLGSTGMVTDNNADITQGFLYAPFGEIVNEYSGLNYNVIPKYSFNAKELDEENGMYYYSARYYAPPTFISRDPMFEKYPSISPYTYCANNPMKYIDFTGEEFGDPLKKMQVRRNSVLNTFGLVRKNNDGTPRSHQGIDYYAPVGTDVYAVKTGIVVKVIQSEEGGDYGTQIIIQHYDDKGEPIVDKEGNYEYSFYAHLSKTNIKVGDPVKENETIIGKTGKTGNAKKLTDKQDEHLHFEIRTSINLGKGLKGRKDPNEVVDTKYKLDPSDKNKVIMIEKE